MPLSRRFLLGTAAAAPFAPWPAARAAEAPIRIGVLTDLSGPYRDDAGPGAVACAHQAVADYKAAGGALAVEIVAADHQQKPDVAAAIAREWFDRDGVDMITEINNSAIALACDAVAREKDKVQLNTGAASSDLTGKRCSPNLIHWTYDTWMCAHSIGSALVKTGGDSWFFISADYTFGQTLQRDTANFVRQSGGKVLGTVAYPFPGTSDFSSFLLQAQSSGAKVVAFANAGHDLINCVKQAHEFGLTANGTRLAGMIVFVTEIHALGLDIGQGLSLCETYYWDLNDRTRALARRVGPNMPGGAMPNMIQAGVYSAVLNYLKVASALGAAGAKASGRTMVAAMKHTPTDDDAFGPGVIRADGRKIHPAYLFRVKSPAESRSAWDCYALTATIPADQAFRPLAEGGCALVTG